MNRRQLFGGICSVFMVLSGCATVTPIGPGFVYEPDEREQRLWKSVDESSEAFRASGAMYENEELQAYVQSVIERVLGDNLSAYVPLKPSVFIVDSPVVNAFAFPNGHIFVHTGFLGRLRNEAQLAMLLGHEITHATHRHADQRIDDATTRTDILAYVSVLSVVGGADLSNATTDLGTLMTLAAISGYSRKMEAEADRVGLTLVAQAGYSPDEGAKMFQRAVDASDRKDRNWNALYATHPKMKQRVKSCTKLVKRLHPDLQTEAKEIGRDRYVTHAADLIYGEASRHITKGKFELALDTLRFMREVRPLDARASAILGDFYRTRNQTGDPELAEEVYRAGLQLDPRLAEAHRGLGFIMMKGGSKTDAIRHLRKYVDLCPDASDAELVLQYIRKLEAGE